MSYSDVGDAITPNFLRIGVREAESAFVDQIVSIVFNDDDLTRTAVR